MSKVTIPSEYHTAVDKVNVLRARHRIGVRALGRMIGQSHTLVSLVLNRKKTSRPAVGLMLAALARHDGAVVGRERKAS